jgi:hypothetical protein
MINQQAETTEMTSAQVFARYAGSEISRWRMLEGASLHHSRFGHGSVVSVTRTSAGIIVVTTSFPGITLDKGFAASAFGDVITAVGVTLPLEITQQLESEATRRNLHEQAQHEARQEAKRQAEELSAKVVRACPKRV